MKTYDELITDAQRTTTYLGGDHPDAIKANARVCARAIEDGIWGALPYVPRPDEVPDEDAELHDAATSTKAADRDLRRAVMGWQRDNESVEVENAQRLLVCALNFADLETLRVQGDEAAREIQVVIYLHSKRALGGDVTQAPAEREALWRWCRRCAGAKSPVPVWLRCGAQPRKAWKPKPRGGEPARVGNLFGGDL